ncbi:DUF5363 family protein [Vibrio maerlii]|uniref:DUF5363 family protein n=1 Tax=Vibrio maerlii TaxID=2231648 RepID=UPI0019CFD18D|nr:DUF5363 family protein [Vibrio maerlii]
MKWLKRVIARYDAWCEELGLTPDKKRSCVPYKAEPTTKSADDKKVETERELTK